MADSATGLRGWSKVAFALLAVGYLVPLVMWSAVFTGLSVYFLAESTGIIKFQADPAMSLFSWAALTVLVGLVMLPSAVLATGLTLGYWRKGFHWLTARWKGLLVAGLFGPLAMVVYVVMMAGMAYSTSQDGLGMPLPEGFWQRFVLKHALTILWSLLFLPLLAWMRFSARRRTV
ncbi:MULTISPECIES: hypothetical protein [Dyella]|uniref:Uncharacterized protein n=2 Tax=Dyella TaxID=231454 RepID=A0A4R0YSG2_9GAMM|nr:MULTISPECIES: hypothetical protein [Dyella]TBR40256.1 hypothetical protein EYV96_08855 [Dyella terrae]TCI12162.1 hypothetical protein EZM97_02015 [Dyella soli]